MTVRKNHLRAVDESEAPKPRVVYKQISAALEGSARDVLAAMRLTLAKKIDSGEVSSNSIASAYKELRELDRLIRAADAAEREEVASGDIRDDDFDATAI